MTKNNEKIFAAWVGMIRSHQMFMEVVETALKNANMPPLAWYDVLLEINREPDKRLRLQDIGVRILLAKNNTTRLIDRLEKEKLVHRKKCKSDGRGVYAYITPEGEQLIKDMWPIYKTAVKENFGEKLTPTELETLVNIHQKIR